MEGSEYLKRLMTTTTTRSIPIACRVCDKIFFDNVSLVYHFESHLHDESVNRSQHGRTMAALLSSWNLPSNFSAFPSASERMNDALRVEFPRTYNYSKPFPCPVFSAKLANGMHSNLVSVPILTSMSPLTPSDLDPNRNFFMSHVAVTPIYPQVGANASVDDLRKLHPLRFRGQKNVGRNAGGYKTALIDQLEKPFPEIIVISDDEGGEKNSGEEIDLNLKL